MSSQNSQISSKEAPLQMEIWDNPHKPGFMFQQYRALNEGKVLAYEALAILKNADGSPLANNLFFDQLREMESSWQIEIDRFLVPLAIAAAAEKKRIPVAVNVHLASLCEPDFLKLVRVVIEKCGLQQSDVLFEIVEPHVPTEEQLACIEQVSSRSNPDGFVLIIDDHDFENGHDRLSRLAPLCEMVKIDMDQAKAGFSTLRENYPHLAIVLERVTFNDRENIFALYPGVFVQGI